MAASVAFQDLDNQEVYDASRSEALKASARNFVVAFGQEQAKVAFNVHANSLEKLLEARPTPECPVRWINIWGPHLQTNLIDVIVRKYEFSPRLGAIIKSEPLPRSADKKSATKHDGRPPPKNDVEVGTKSLDTPRSGTFPQTRNPFSHYAIAHNMQHYQSNDIADKFICIGANWMHDYAQPESKKDARARGGKQRPLWMWLVLCHDNTVISIHQDPGSPTSPKELESIRQNTISVLSQLSQFGHESADPVSIQTIRQTLNLKSEKNLNPGSEGASNLFYYLFDDWRAVYSTIARYRKKLSELEDKIIHDMSRASSASADIEIIPDLHDLGRQIHRSDHLYAGYRSTISRILTEDDHIVLAQSAASRFERLSDRIQLVILNTTQEFLAEKEGLVSTYFNINAQKDSEATARLSRAAALLAKLSVLFLPVSLMTSYFSVQIPELQSYTAKDYWDSFAVIFSISFLCLFFFSKLLMWITETLDAWVKRMAGKATKVWPRRNPHPVGHHDDNDDAGGYDEKE